MTTNPAQVDVYGRVSRDDDERQRSTEGQVADCTDRVAELGFSVGEVHVDDGRSAWNPRVRRPGWDRLMDRLESGETGGVVVFDMARFSRRPIEGERLIAAAERGLIVLDSEDAYDLRSPNGKSQFRDQMKGAAYESDRLSTRVRRGKRIKAKSGESNASSRPFGFRAVQVEKEKKVKGKPKKVLVWDYTGHDQTEAAILRDLTERLLAGESQDAMIRDLNRRGVVTSADKPWTRAGLRQVLTRPRNAGLISYHDTVVSRLPGTPIIDEATWERVLSVYAARRRGRPISAAYLLSGVVVCGHCGHRLTGRPRKNMKPYEDGSVRRQYWCQPRSHDGGCGRISVDQRELDRHVGALVVAVLSDPRHAAAVERASASAAAARRSIEAEISDCEHLAEQLADRLGRGELSLSRYDAAVAPLDRRLLDLRDRLGQAIEAPEAAVPPEVIAAARGEWQSRWEAATVAERRTMLRLALRRRRLVVMPADPSAPRRFDPRRVTIQDQVA